MQISPDSLQQLAALHNELAKKADDANFASTAARLAAVRASVAAAKAKKA